MFGSKNRRISALEAEMVDLAKRLKAEIATCDALDRTAKKYRQERDDYRERLLRFTAPRERGPGGRFVKIGDGGSGFIRPTNGAAAQAVVS